MRGECFRYINKIKINIFMHSTPCFVLNISMLFIFLVHDNNRIMNHCSQYECFHCHAIRKYNQKPFRGQSQEIVIL